MPDGFEYIVRPYQSPNANGTTIIPSTPTISAQRATLTWGSTAQMPIPEIASVSVACCTEALKEQSRLVQAIRIYQDGNPNSSSYVDIARPQQMTLQKKDTTQCLPDDFDQISYVAASLTVFDEEMNALFAPFDSTDQHCKASWTFTHGVTPP
jgi:hypothetical protein